MAKCHDGVALDCRRHDGGSQRLPSIESLQAPAPFSELRESATQRLGISQEFVQLLAVVHRRIGHLVAPDQLVLGIQRGSCIRKNSCHASSSSARRNPSGLILLAYYPTPPVSDQSSPPRSHRDCCAA